MFGFRLLVWLHIVGGSVALLSGPVPILSRKGSWLHKRVGTLYATAMILSSVSAVALAAMTRNVLLLVIAVFSFFLVFTGVRAIALRRGGAVFATDEMVCVITAGFSAWLIWLGFGSGDITDLFFGAAGICLSIRQERLLQDEDTDWVGVHLGAMCGAYIATVSAFLVVNLTFLPRPLLFIGPTLIGAPLIAWTAIRRRRNFSPA